MKNYYAKATLVEKYLEGLNIHPITVTEAISDENYNKSYNLIIENPKITKQEFLNKLGIGEYRQ